MQKPAWSENQKQLRLIVDVGKMLDQVVHLYKRIEQGKIMNAELTKQFAKNYIELFNKTEPELQAQLEQSHLATLDKIKATMSSKEASEFMAIHDEIVNDHIARLNAQADMYNAKAKAIEADTLRIENETEEKEREALRIFFSIAAIFIFIFSAIYFNK